MKYFIEINALQFGLPRWLRGKESMCSVGASGDSGSIPGWEDPLED